MARQLASAFFLFTTLVSAAGNTPHYAISVVAGMDINTEQEGKPLSESYLGMMRQIRTPDGRQFFVDPVYPRVMEVREGVLRTVAGTGISGFYGDGGPANAARLYNPRAVATDSSGNVYIADSTDPSSSGIFPGTPFRGHRVRRVSPAGIIQTVAGNGQNGSTGDGGPARSAALSDPIALAIDSAGNLYIADSRASRIRKVDPAGVISTVAELRSVTNVWVDRNDALYAYSSAGLVRLVDSALVPYGPARFATGVTPFRVCPTAAESIRPYSNVRVIDRDGSILVPHGGGDDVPLSICRISPDRKVTPVVEGLPFTALRAFGVTGGEGGGSAWMTDGQDHWQFTAGNQRVLSGSTSYPFHASGRTRPVAAFPRFIAEDGQRGIVFTQGRQIRRISVDGELGPVAGTGADGSTGDGGPARSAALLAADSLVLDSQGNVYFSESIPQPPQSGLARKARIRRVTPAGIIDTFGGGGDITTAPEIGQSFKSLRLDNAGRLIALPDGTFYITYGSAAGAQILKVDRQGKVIAAHGPGMKICSREDNVPLERVSFSGGLATIASDPLGNTYIAMCEGVRRIDPQGRLHTFSDGSKLIGQTSRFRELDLARTLFATDGKVFFLFGWDNRIYLGDPAADTITHIAGSGIRSWNGDGLSPFDTDLLFDGLVAFESAFVNAAGEVFFSTLLSIRKLTPVSAAVPMLNGEGPISNVTGVPGPLAPGQVVTTYGRKLGSGGAVAPEGATAPSLAGLTVLIEDAAGVEHTAGLLSVAEDHVTFIVPMEVSPGPATLIYQVAKDSSARMPVFIYDAAPGLYAYSAGDRKLAVGWVLQPDAEGNESVRATLACEEGVCQPAQVVFNEGNTEAKLRLSANGISKANLEQVQLMIGDQLLPIQAVVPGGRPGEELLECMLPTSLTGAGLVPVEIVVSGQRKSNRVWLLL